MLRRPPISTRTDTLFPYTTLFRSVLFPELCPAGVPTGPTTYEVTRLCLPVRHGAAERLRIRNALITAMVDHALTNGITRLTGVVAAAFLAQILRKGRSEERGVGTECVSTCRSRWSPTH